MDPVSAFGQLELDTELEHLETPDTEGKSPAELRRMGSEAQLRRNRRWDAFACFRDAYHRLELNDAAERQLAVSQLNLASVWVRRISGLSTERPSIGSIPAQIHGSYR